MATIKPRRGTGVPSGLSQNELAIDPTNRRVYLGNVGGTGTVVASHITDYVSSLNGATGAVGVTGANGITISVSGNTLTASLTTTGVVAGACGSSTRSPIITVDAYGRITDISSTLISASTVTNTDQSSTNTDYKVSLNNGAATSSVIYDTTFTFNPGTNTLSFPAGSTLYFGGIGNIRSASDISGGGKTFTVAPFGGIVLAPTTSGGLATNIPSIKIANSAGGEVLIEGGDLRLGTKDSGLGAQSCALIFEGDSDNTFETTLVATDPTADRTIQLPNSSGTVALTNSVVTSVNGSIGAITNIAVTNAAQTFSGTQTFSSGISAASAITGGSYVYAQEGYRVGSSALSAKTGTTYTFVASDDGKIFTSSNASAQTFTIPTGLPVGFNCTLIQIGAGSLSVTGASGVTVNSFNSKYTLAGQHAAVSIVSYTTNVFNLAGGLTA